MGKWHTYEFGYEKTPWYLRVMGHKKYRKLVLNTKDSDCDCLFSFNSFSYYTYSDTK